jgi:LPXTG-motif cell wall-anchored protein
MKASLFIAAGVAIIATAVYYWKFKKKTTEASLPEKENERHHLTNVFSRAKEVAIGN